MARDGAGWRGMVGDGAGRRGVARLGTARCGATLLLLHVQPLILCRSEVGYDAVAPQAAFASGEPTAPGRPEAWSPLLRRAAVPYSAAAVLITASCFRLLVAINLRCTEACRKMIAEKHR